MKIEIKKINASQLILMVKKLLLMDPAVYLNLDSERIYSNNYLPTKDVVKSVTLPIDEVFDLGEFEGTVKLAFFDGSRAIDCLKYFDLHDLRGDIHCFRDGEELFAEKMVIRDSKLEIQLLCQEVSLGFTDMNDQQLDAAFNDSNPLFNFNLSQSDLAKLSSLIHLDKEETFDIYADEETGVHVSGNTYDIIIDPTQKVSNPKVHIFKKFFTRIDKENYEISVHQNKMILNSQDSDTKVAFNLAIKPE